MDTQQLRELATDVHDTNVAVGWWDDWLDDKTVRYDTAMMLVVSELSEAMEGHRKDLMDDHLPKYRMFDVELADAMIRLLDAAGAYYVAIPDNMDLMVLRTCSLWSVSEKSVPEQLYATVRSLVGPIMRDPQESVVSGMVDVMAMAELNDVDLWPVVAAKRKYNATRADHKRDARAKQNGKKY